MFFVLFSTQLCESCSYFLLPLLLLEVEVLLMFPLFFLILLLLDVPLLLLTSIEHRFLRIIMGAEVDDGECGHLSRSRRGGGDMEIKRWYEAGAIPGPPPEDPSEMEIKL